MNLTDSQKHYIRSSFASMQDKNDFLALLNKAKLYLFGESKERKIREFSLYSLNYYSNTTLNIKRYKTFKVRKKNGKDRIISSPVRGLKLILRCLNLVLQCVFEKELFQNEKNANAYVMGFLPNRGIKENAQAHINKNYVYNLDLQDFFHQIELHRIKACLKLSPFKLDKTREPLAFLIANLCCEKIKKEKRNEKGEKISIENAVLPQGAPTSPILSNIVCQKLDRRLNGLAKRFNASYTRYADDITFSSNYNIYKEDSEFIKELYRIIKEQNFTINTEKTRLQKSGYKQEVTGLIVNEKVNVNQHYIKNLRTIIHNWEKMGKEDAEQIFRQNYKNDKGHIQKGTPSMKQVVEGKLNFLRMIRGGEDAVYKKLWERFAKLKENIKDKTKPNKSNYNEKWESENLAHDPFRVVQFLKYFSKHDILKYATHNWEKGKFENGYETYITQVEKAWKEDFQLLRNYNNNLSAKIWSFLLAKKEETSGWGEYRILIGWATEELANYAKKGNYPFNFELPPIFAKENREKIELTERKKIVRFSDLIEIFKNEIEFRDSRTLRKVMLRLVAEYLPKSDYNVTLGDLGFSFYTDVQWVKEGIIHIFRQFSERKQHINIHIWAKEQDNSVYLYIVQKGSFVEDKSPTDNKFLDGGDFSRLGTTFRSLCNWSIEAKFKDGNYYRLNLLHSDSNVPKIENNIPEVEGFTHILQFYL